MEQTMGSRFFSFVGATSGEWRVSSIVGVAGANLEGASCLQIHNANLSALPEGACWVLRGVTSNARYTTRAEQTALAALQAPIGRPHCSHAALIPITKNALWWSLTQDERREIMEERSAHIEVGMRYLPAIARRLHHGRDIGEPFDFLTYFEYAQSESAAFEELVGALRRSEEWKYVEREVDIRLERDV